MSCVILPCGVVVDDTRRIVLELGDSHCIMCNFSKVLHTFGCDTFGNTKYQQSCVPCANSKRQEGAQFYQIRTSLLTTTLRIGQGLLVGKDSAELGDHVNAVLHEGCDSNNGTINLLRNLTARYEFGCDSTNRNLVSRWMRMPRLSQTSE